MIKTELFEKYNGTNIYKYTISDDISVSIITLGARIFEILIPDKNGKIVDVALNMTTADDIVRKSGFMGATIGRCCNRIGQGCFKIGNAIYPIVNNEKSAHLHGGKIGFDKKVFVAEKDDKNNSVTMRYFSPDGEEGYPGNLNFSVTFTVRGRSLILEYEAVSDKDTIFCPTNHTYFNLNGESDGCILDNVLTINADSYLPTDEMWVTTGEIKSVTGTPFDFRKPKRIDRDINVDDNDLKNAKGGYDHNFCLTDRHFATVYSEKTGIQMDCYTDMPGVQFYSGNLMNGKTGKSLYAKYSGFCLETQLYPDAIHKPEWQSPILKADEKFYSRTEYCFSLKL